MFAGLAVMRSKIGKVAEPKHDQLADRLSANIGLALQPAVLLGVRRLAVPTLEAVRRGYVRPPPPRLCDNEPLRP